MVPIMDNLNQAEQCIAVPPERKEGWKEYAQRDRHTLLACTVLKRSAGKLFCL
jgi:hypothetical protein